MSKQLPERPDLGQLKKQAKDLLNEVRAGRPEAVARVPEAERPEFSLADAQRIIAREYGFPSWPKLKLHVETRDHAIAMARLVGAAVNGDAATVAALCQERPGLARESVSACAALGDLEGLAAWVKRNPEFARAQGGIARTEALGYVCLGRVGADDAGRVACADLLLAAGANPNATWAAGESPEEAMPILYAAAGRNNLPRLTARLLAAGAQPNDGESIYHAAEHYHPECLAALVAAGGDISRRDEKWQNTPLYFLIGWEPGARNSERARQGILWLLEHGANPNIPSYEVGETPLFGAIRNGWDLELIEAFVRHGADVQFRRTDGRSACAVAVRYGRTDAVKFLLAQGAPDDASPEDRFLGALAAADETEARRWLRENPGWKARHTGKIAKVLLLAARRGTTPVLALAARLGLDFDRPDRTGQRPLHGAAFYGRAEAVAKLLELGADLERPDDTYHASPLGWCVYGSTHCAAVGADYGGAAAAFRAAGAVIPPVS
ncbi:MAG TPA: ankyrin repeat domain-containing protein, partial [Opitutaceae bacterium]|nr:ankyrin repeat domain-containing protein [Opitutaceae bacterium]